MEGVYIHIYVHVAMLVEKNLSHYTSLRFLVFFCLSHVRYLILNTSHYLFRPKTSNFFIKPIFALTSQGYNLFL